MSDSLWPHELKHTRLLCFLPPPGASSNSCPLSQWCHPTILSSAIVPSSPPFSLSQHQGFFFFFFPNELALSIRGPKYWSFSFSISPSNQDSGLISFRTDWFYFHAVHGVPRVFSSISVQKWECKLVQPLWRTMWRLPKKLEIELPYDPAIPLLGIHTEETRSKETRVPQCSSQHCL